MNIGNYMYKLCFIITFISCFQDVGMPIYYIGIPTSWKQLMNVVYSFSDYNLFSIYIVPGGRWSCVLTSDRYS